MRTQDISIPHELSNLSKLSVNELVQGLGVEPFREVIVDIMLGKNVRNFTEILTRTRLIRSNIALWDFFCDNKKRGISPIDLINLAKEKLDKGRNSPKEKAVYQWLTSITGKQEQNVLRDNEDPNSFEDLTNATLRILSEEASKLGKTTPSIAETRNLFFTPEELYWIFMVVGSQTLTIRGSEKSLHGKYFEKLILGSVFQVLGFKWLEVNNISQTGFWLSSQNTESRESDATLVHENQGIRIDIGFIGRGNTEISLDKVSRYAKFDEIAGQPYHMSTIVIVDTIGSRSKISSLAEQIDGQILQMSDKAWVSKLANSISEKFNLPNPIAHIRNEEELRMYLEEKIKVVNIERLIKVGNMGEG